MTATSVSPHLASRLINGILAIKPLANLAKRQARQMMIKRAESIDIYWTNEVNALRARAWEHDLAQVQKTDLNYPDYYVTSFHAYEEGNLGWQPALEVEVAAHAAHARIWKDAGAKGDAQLRQSYHDVLKAQLPKAPATILDIGCSVGMSTFALQNAFPDAQVTGLDLSPYFLAVAKYRGEGGRQEAGGTRQKAEESQLTTNNQQLTVPSSPHSPLPTPHSPIWLHAAAESTGLPDASFDLVSACLLFHELPQSAAIAIIREARRLLRPGGHLAIMDMNPKSEIFAKMPPYVKTLLKSTEPYLDEYFSLDLEETIAAAGFTQPTVMFNSPRHRSIIAQRQ
ncbi:class I SAM-dependent methyltransferase [Phormidium sp. FACHB-592]|uniref:Class I SAM-dependent methyltransferase n=1 Tax=Stenomitos frigidus AS-A4 TaxID=2933935 RepID=A0ABV0KHK1_9CYAN|nr:class I SAM-dependent methyltransferase [Phormidium sp. FACHB-592]MBD2073622.1 class I SAM-dependent methyltransferase [Phormidium sp. FACHB-592]